MDAPFKSPAARARFLAAYERALARWPVAFEDRVVPTRFGATAVRVSGRADAPPLVLLHGARATSAMWLDLVAGLGEDRRVHAVDTLGDVGRSVPEVLPRSGADYVAWLGEVLRGLGLARPALFGVSFGGWISLRFASAAPERVERLALISPAASFFPMSLGFYARGLPGLLPLRPIVRASVAAFSALGRGFHELPLGPLMTEAFLAAGMLHVIPDVLADAELARVTCPVLLMIGEREFMYAPARALARAQRHVPRLEAAVFADAAHALSADQPERVLARARRFFAGSP